MSKMRKPISWLLTLAMVFTMLPMSVFAAGTGNPTPGPVTSSDGLVTVEKSAQAVPGKEDTYEVTLEVTTEDKVEVQPQDPAHVVLVIDASGSMAGDRLAKTKAAAKEFAGIMLGEGAADDNQIAVVTYSDNGAIKQGFTHDFSAIEAAINGIKANGGTNIQGGLYWAEEVIKQDNSDAEKVILLFSDGYPTYCYELTGTASGNCHGSGLGGPATRVNGDTIEITGRNEGKVIGAGSDDVVTGDWWDIFDLFASNLSLTVTCTADYWGHDWTWGKNHTFPKDVEYDYATKSLVDKADTSSATLWEADQAKQLADVYTVLLNPSNSSEAQKAKALMEKLATGDKYYLAEDAEELGELFKGIAGDLVTPTNAGTVTDPMAQFVTLDESSISDKNAVDVEGNSFTWNVAASEPVVNGNQKTYTLTYQVTLDTDNAGFTTGEHALNGPTTFTYRVQGDESDRTVNFNVPTVYEEAVRYQVSYQWSGNVPAGEETPDAVTDLADGAKYTVDEKYTQGYTVNTYDEYNNVNGTYTFSGWKLGDSVVTGEQTIYASSVELKGEWTFAEVNVPGYKVTYDWGTAPENVYNADNQLVTLTLPSNSEEYVKGESYPVDNTYTAGYTVYTHDANGNINGKYTFSGWTAPNGGVMAEGGATITGKWEHKDVTVQQHNVTYDWGTENVPSTVTLPGPFTVDNNATHTVDTTYYRGYQVITADGTYTFNGWDHSGTITVTDDVTIKGSWTFVPATPPK